LGKTGRDKKVDRGETKITQRKTRRRSNVQSTVRPSRNCISPGNERRQGKEVELITSRNKWGKTLVTLPRGTGRYRSMNRQSEREKSPECILDKWEEATGWENKNLPTEVKEISQGGKEGLLDKNSEIEGAGRDQKKKIQMGLITPQKAFIRRLCSVRPESNRRSFRSGRVETPRKKGNKNIYLGNLGKMGSLQIGHQRRRERKEKGLMYSRLSHTCLQPGGRTPEKSIQWAIARGKRVGIIHSGTNKPSHGDLQEEKTKVRRGVNQIHKRNLRAWVLVQKWGSLSGFLE